MVNIDLPAGWLVLPYSMHKFCFHQGCDVPIDELRCANGCFLKLLSVVMDTFKLVFSFIQMMLF